MQSDRTEFWVVWRPRGGPPTVRHRTRQQADVEASRLAEENPGQGFFVLKAEALVYVASCARVDRLAPVPPAYDSIADIARHAEEASGW